MGVKDVNQRFKVRFIMDNVDEQIDTVSRSVLALTVSCARCHDHKFDPIPTTDYYALAGIFRSTDLCAGLRNKMGGGGLDYYDTPDAVALGPKTRAQTRIALRRSQQAKRACEEAKAEFEAIVDTPEGPGSRPGRPAEAAAVRMKMNRLQNELLALDRSRPIGQGGPGRPRRQDRRRHRDPHPRRGREARPDRAARVPHASCRSPDVPKVNPSQSGRLELAQWLTSEQNPLTPRVMANRVWQHLFGAGAGEERRQLRRDRRRAVAPGAARSSGDAVRPRRLVGQEAGADDRAEPGLSAELGRFAKPTSPSIRPTGWSGGTARGGWTPRRSATPRSPPPARSTWPGPRRRPPKDLKVIELPNNGPTGPAARASRPSPARTAASICRCSAACTPTSLEVFDFAEQGMVTGSATRPRSPPRPSTCSTTRSCGGSRWPWPNGCSSEPGRTTAAVSTWVYRLTVGRPATAAEIERAERYLAEYESAVREVIASTPVEPRPRLDAIAALATADSTGKDAAGSPHRLRTRTKSSRWRAPVKEEVIAAADPRTAAWASFCQALLGRAEFRYIK